MSDEWEETGSSGPYSLLQQGEDALKGIQQREFVHTKRVTGEFSTSTTTKAGAKR